MPTTTLLDFPTEILHLIADFLDPPSLMKLRISCQDLHTSIPPLSHDQLLEAEASDFGITKDLYACRDCLRVRPRSKFADNMLKKKRAKFAADARTRFCVDCGINPRQGTTRYCRGSHIVMQGELYVICLSCGKFGRGVVENGKSLSECQRCRFFSRAIEQRAEEYRARQERAVLRTEQARRRARKYEDWGSEYEDSEEDIPPSPTWSEIEMDMAQAEANRYMTSPKPGSE